MMKNALKIMFVVAVAMMLVGCAGAQNRNGITVAEPRAEEGANVAVTEVVPAPNEDITVPCKKIVPAVETPVQVENSTDASKKVVATGVAVVQGENVTGARQKAIQDALRQALEQGVGMLMDATTILKNEDLLEKIYTNTQGYITRYEVIKERKEQNGLYRVKIQAEVKTGAIRDALVKLGLIKEMMDYPRAMILLHPQQMVSSAAQTAETVLIKNLTDKRFDLVDPAKSRELHNEAKELFKIDTIENVAARIGLNHHAEIVVLYRLNEAPSEYDGMMETASVTFGTKAIVTTTAQILTADEKTVPGVGNSADLARRNGAQRAAEAIVNPMMNRIVSWWTDYIANGVPYIITLQTPPRSYRTVLNFQKAIKSIPGVVSLSERSSGGGMTEMMAKYKGNSAEFKEAIFSTIDLDNRFSKLEEIISKGRFLVFSVK